MVRLVYLAFSMENLVSFRVSMRNKRVSLGSVDM